MAELKGTKTAQNLLTSFVGESQANMRYTYAAKTAEKEGYRQIAAIFRETAMNEREHAARFYKFLKEEYKLETIELTEGYTAWPVIEGENDECENMYPSFADVAEEEGFDEIARAFRNIAKVEGAHRDRYQKLHDNVENGTVFEKEEAVIWKCGNCGFLYEGKKAPKLCPACHHEQEWFEVAAFNY